MIMEVKIWMMNRKEVCKAFGTSSAGLHRGMADGRYPKPYRTGPNSVRWKSNEVQERIDKLQIAVPVEVAPGVRKGRKPAVHQKGRL
jgi:predicted DNA-binding transcriptional regulator AlpA